MKGVGVAIWIGLGVVWLCAPAWAAPAAGPATAKAPDKELDPKDLFSQASPAVVRIVVFDARGLAVKGGSGFFVSSEGLIVTNHHVISDAYRAEVILESNAKFTQVGVLLEVPENDLALLKVDGRRLPCLSVGKGIPDVGSKVYALGSPQGLTNTMSNGLVSGIRKVNEALSLVQTTAPISRGSSGGPLVLATGEVTGVTTATFVEGQNLNFAVPAERVQALIDTGRGRTPRVLGAGRAGSSIRGPAAPPRAAPILAPRPNRVAKVYYSMSDILSEVPEDVCPIRDGTRNWNTLTTSLFNRWARESLAWHQFCLTEEWRSASAYSSYIRAVLYHAERCRDNRTYYITVTCLFGEAAAGDLARLKAGQPVTIQGTIQSVTVYTGSTYYSPGSPWSGPPSRSPSGSAANAPIRVSIGLSDCEIVKNRIRPAPDAREPIARDTPTADDDKKGELSDEQKAQGRLRLAEGYEKAGLKDKAREVLEALVEAYPDTKTALEARRRLKAMK